MSSIDYDHTTTGQLIAIDDHVIVVDMDAEDEKIVNGIIIPSERGGDRGVHPRWAQICAVGPKQEDVRVGEWVLVEHGRWTRGIKLEDGRVYRKVDSDDILLVSEERLSERK